jgi:ribosome-binding protein aMBF1 (putative translation factor)
VDEQHFSEIERVLLYVSEARERAGTARAELAKAGAPAHLIAALETTEVAMRAEHRRLMQSTFYAVPGQDKLAV